MGNPLSFGKYKGKTIEEISTIKQGREDGASYLEWLRDNSDVNDPKYAAKNKALVAEINRVLGSKVKYVKDNTQLPKGSESAGLDKKLDFIIEMFKRSYPEIYQEIMFENTPKKDDVPF